MRFEELPEGIRVKLYPEKKKELWQEVARVGASRAAEKMGFSRSKIYGWKSRDLFLPAEFVSEFVEVERVKQMKGGGRSRPVEEVDFPLPESAELATRRASSVSVNRDGVPVYQASDAGNLRRFAQLLEDLGSSYTVYRRGLQELRYPAFVDSIIQNFSTDTEFAALVDEEGSVEDGKLVAAGRSVPVEDFEGRLYSSKRLELAVERGDQEQIAEILAEQAERASSILD